MPDDLEKILRILVRYGVDPAGVQTIEQANQKLAASFQKPRAELKATQQQAALSWREFVAANMSEQMKLTGSHSAAMKVIGQKWQELKASVQGVGSAQQQAAQVEIKNLGDEQKRLDQLIASYRQRREAMKQPAAARVEVSAAARATPEETQAAIERGAAIEATQKSLEDQAPLLRAAAAEWQRWREEMNLTQEEAVRAIQAGATGAQLTEDQIRAVGTQYDALKDKVKSAEAVQVDAAKQVTAAEEQVTAAQKQRASAMQEASNLRGIGRRLAIDAREIQMIGAAMTAPFLLALYQYQHGIGKADDLTKEWMASVGEIQKSQESIGRTVQQTLLPVMKSLASLAQQAAQFVQQHPDVVKAALVIGGTLATIGTLLRTAAGVIQAISALKWLTTYFSSEKQLLVAQQNLTAAQLASVAADKQLAAAQEQLAAATAQGAAATEQVAGGAATTAAGGAAIAGGGLAGLLAPAAFVLIGANIAKWIGDGVTRGLGGVPFDEKVAAMERIKAAIDALPEGERANKIKEIAEQLDGLSDPQKAQKLNELAAGMEEAAQSTADLTTAVTQLSERERIVTMAMLAQAAQMAQQVGQKMGGILGGVAAGFGVLAQTGLADQIRNDPAIRAYEDYQKRLVTIEKKYDDERAKVLEEALKQSGDMANSFNMEMQKAAATFAREQARAAAEFQMSQVKAAQNFAREEAKAEAQYYASRLQEAARYGEEVQRMERDHQVQMQRLSQDHNKNLRKLADQRDALGIEDEMDRYNTERQRAEEDYQRQAADKAQEFARQMAEREQQFQQQRAEALANFKQQQKDARDNFTEQQKQRAADFNAQQAERVKAFQEEVKQRAKDNQMRLDDLKSQNATQRLELYNDFIQREAELGVFIGIQADQWQNYYNLLATGLANLITGAQQQIALIAPPMVGDLPGTPTGGTPRPPGRGPTPYQLGGYAAGGAALLHPGEFILNAATTRQAEAAMGDRLSQEKIVSMLNRPSAGAITLQANVKIDQSFGSVSDPQQIKRLTQDAAYEAVMKVGEKLRSVMGARV